MSKLRRETIRLAHSQPQDSKLRKALLEVLSKEKGRAKMKRTIQDTRSGDAARKGNVYDVLDFVGDQVVLRVPTRKRGVPEEFYVDRDDVELLEPSDS